MSLFSRMILPTVLVFSACGVTFSQDVIYLKTGESLACQVDDLTDNIVNFSLLPSAGTAGGSARRTIPADLVAYVELAFKPGEEAFFADREKATAEQLKGWWEFHFPHLHRPRSRAAAYGLAFAHALVREEPVTGVDRALSLFDRIIARAWSEEDVAAAKHGRLNALMAKGDLETATVEARMLARQTEDPDLLIEVNYLLAKADAEKLKALEAEHPRWMDDDEVRPERNQLYHGALDQFLWPHLFHATREEVAARGLFSAADFCLYAGEVDLARDYWVDLTHLYPETSFAALATERIQSLSNSTSPTTPPTESNP